MATSKQVGEETSDNEEKYEDAMENVHISQTQDLKECLKECGIALQLFLTNKFAQSKNRMEPGIDSSMYHALGYGTILYTQAVMTFDMADIETAIGAIKRSLVVCNKYRRKISFLNSFGKEASKNNYSELSDEEIHAELCYAECLLVRALLTFIQDENLISFVKGGLKIRECYKVYKECAKILAHRKWESEDQKHHFESGVRMGIGSFNLMISLLPGKVLRLLEFVGFSGNKKLGLSELEKGSELFTSLRGPFCSIILIAYHTVVCYVLGLADGDIDLANRLLQPCLVQYPRGALFLFYAGRIHEIKGEIDEAIEKLEESIESQHEWRQFHHLCYWELMWCHCYKGDWLIGMKYAERLCKESRWSKATYTYQKAAFLMMCDDQTEDTKNHLTYLMGEVPRLKQRIAGKSLPIEKFAVFKAKRFMEQNGYLTLPALELVYTWNGFSIIGKRRELLEPILITVEKTINTIMTNKDEYTSYMDDYRLALLLKGVCQKYRGQFLYYYEYTSYMDDYCLALLLKGVCQKYRGQYLQAEQCFLEVIENEKKIKHDTFLPPYATVEMALLCLEQNRVDDVRRFLERAKKNYRGYLLESRLHFRIHATRLKLNTHLGEDEQLHDSTPASSPMKEVNSIVNDEGPTSVALENDSHVTKSTSNGLSERL